MIRTACTNDAGQSRRIEERPGGMRFVNGNNRLCPAVSYGSSAPHAPLAQHPCGALLRYGACGPRR
ncbi:RICIN domain-containing protein [Streptomyces sp. CBMA123]|uniref:RICIN domain-containing protein n=1 Tax=Streptomyces sp. CBMA123 TaxID=1896313 RepID=UPI001661E968|nr:hypothetical protein [Streptomyces sp. CBMA123]MBD0694666.1 hypothetical protein [Streptomyces sp. CBMA123]